jgi:hypothetical protein
MTVYRQWTRARAVLHQHEAHADRRGNGGPKVFSMSKDILSLNVSKSIGQAAGGFSMTLVPRQNYLTEIRNNDWVELFLDTATQESSVPFMVASVDRVSRRRRVDTHSGATTEVISLSGRDYGKVLLSITLIFNPVIGSLVEPARFMTSGMLTKHGGNRLSPQNRPDEIVKNLIGWYHNQRFQCTLPASLVSNLGRYAWSLEEPSIAAVPSLAGTLDLVVDATKSTPIVGPGGLVLKLAETRGLWALDGDPNLSGNLWSTMALYSNPILNEMWVDTEDGLPTLHLEERPFSHEAFAALGGAPINSDEVTQEDVGSSDNDTMNWFRVLPDAQFIPAETAYAQGLGYGSMDSMARAGLRKLEATTSFFGEFKGFLATATDGGGAQEDGLLQKWAQSLTEWYFPNDQFLSGTFVSRLRPDIHVGQRLDYTNTRRTSEALSFYVEGVSHSFVYPGASSTTLSVTRGVERKEGMQFPALKSVEELDLSDAVQRLKVLFLQFPKTEDAGASSVSKGVA